MSHPGHLQNPPAPVEPTANAATKTTTKTTATTNAQAHHRPKPKNLARIHNPRNLAAYLERDDTSEMRALGMISADDERSRVGVVGAYLEAWEESWEQMGMEAAPASTPADAEGEEENEMKMKQKSHRESKEGGGDMSMSCEA